MDDYWNLASSLWMGKHFYDYEWLPRQEIRSFSSYIQHSATLKCVEVPYVTNSDCNAPASYEWVNLVLWAYLEIFQFENYQDTAIDCSKTRVLNQYGKNNILVAEFFLECSAPDWLKVAKTLARAILVDQSSKISPRALQMPSSLELLRGATAALNQTTPVSTLTSPCSADGSTRRCELVE